MTGEAPRPRFRWLQDHNGAIIGIESLDPIDVSCLGVTQPERKVEPMNLYGATIIDISADRMIQGSVLPSVEPSVPLIGRLEDNVFPTIPMDKKAFEYIGGPITVVPPGAPADFKFRKNSRDGPLMIVPTTPADDLHVATGAALALMGLPRHPNETDAQFRVRLIERSREFNRHTNVSGVGPVGTPIPIPAPFGRYRNVSGRSQYLGDVHTASGDVYMPRTERECELMAARSQRGNWEPLGGDPAAMEDPTIKAERARRVVEAANIAREELARAAKPCWCGRDAAGGGGLHQKYCPKWEGVLN